MSWFWVQFLVAIYIAGWTCNGQQSSTVGREFVFGILDTISGDFHTNLNLVDVDITNVSPASVNVHLEIPHFNNNSYFILQQFGRKNIRIDPTIQRDGSFTDDRGIRITSDGDISVLVTNALIAGSVIESYNVLPVDTLVTTYIVSGYNSSDNRYGGGVLMCTAVYNDTVIHVYNNTRELYSGYIDAGQVLQYMCTKECDITGVRVVSNKNIFTVAGSPFLKRGTGHDADSMGAAMIPTRSWSNKYIVPPTLPESGFMIRLIHGNSSLNATVSTFQTKTVVTTTSDHFFTDEAVVVTGDTPFSVTHYGISKVNGQVNTDRAFMTVIPGVDQYINDYIFTVPHGYGNTIYFAALIVQEIHKSGLSFDGASSQSYQYAITSVKVPEPLHDYIILTFRIDSGFHRLRHSNTDIKFGLFIYGHGNYGIFKLGSGFYAGMNLNGSSGDTINTCFVCSDLSHPYLCDIVERCTKTELCYLEEYTVSGHIMYRSGCMPRAKCTTNQPDDTCFECCQGSFCNNQGCGEGIPPRDSRGPICFDCEHVASPEECFKVFPCSKDQMCRIEEYSWFGQSNFKLGCGQRLCSHVPRRVGNVTDRSVPVCQSCCEDDYCNRYCTHADAGQNGVSIVG